MNRSTCVVADKIKETFLPVAFALNLNVFEMFLNFRRCNMCGEGNSIPFIPEHRVRSLPWRATITTVEIDHAARVHSTFQLNPSGQL